MEELEKENIKKELLKEKIFRDMLKGNTKLLIEIEILEDIINSKKEKFYLEDIINSKKKQVERNIELDRQYFKPCITYLDNYDYVLNGPIYYYNDSYDRRLNTLNINDDCYEIAKYIILREKLENKTINIII